jgi:predicted nuclease of predicted toxin-antitoxin system
MPPASQVPTWRFLVDDNLPRTLVQALKVFGWQAEHTQEVGLRGRPDSEVFAYAQQHDAAIITQDQDLADRRVYPPPHAGIALVQFPQPWPRLQKEQRVAQALRGLGNSSLHDTLVIVAASQVLVYR